MMAVYTFFAFVVILLIIYQWASMASKEGFDSKHHQVRIPTTVPVPPVLTNEIQPASLPGPLPVAPYQQIASMSPLPYQDTTQIKANRQQLTSLLEMLKGFLAFEAQQLSERSDPTIQLPLQTARSDFQELQSQVSVLNRNPGIQPTITMKHMNDISSNVAFLQQQVRLIGAAGPLQGPTNEFSKEGFTVADGSAGGTASSTTATNGTTTATNGTTTATNGTTTATNGTTTAANRTMAAAGSATTATIAELNKAISAIEGEITRLSASGTTDTLIQKRVANLTRIKLDIKSIVDNVAAKKITPSEIPIKSSDLTRFLPLMGDISKHLPPLITKKDLPYGLGNLLPKNAQQDPDTMRQINKLIDRYADQIVKGVSASFSVRYDPPSKPTESKACPSKASTVDRTGFPSPFDLDNASQQKFMPYDSGVPVTDHMAPIPQEAGRGPSQFDWKQRTKEIEDQVKKRGIRPEDVGMMPSNTKVSPDFSWKGYARMICTRLQATMDPALPVTCGCPPMDWKGWRIAA